MYVVVRGLVQTISSQLSCTDALSPSIQAHAYSVLRSFQRMGAIMQSRSFYSNNTYANAQKCTYLETIGTRAKL